MFQWQTRKTGTKNVINVPCPRINYPYQRHYKRFEKFCNSPFYSPFSCRMAFSIQIRFFKKFLLVPSLIQESCLLNCLCVLHILHTKITTSKYNFELSTLYGSYFVFEQSSRKYSIFILKGKGTFWFDF